MSTFFILQVKLCHTYLKKKFIKLKIANFYKYHRNNQNFKYYIIFSTCIIIIIITYSNGLFEYNIVNIKSFSNLNHEYNMKCKYVIIFTNYCNLFI